MLQRLSKLIAWLQSKEPKWFQKNSWVNEGFIGVVGTGALALWFGHLRPACAVFNVLSFLYERFLDPHRNEPGHEPIDDLGQRAAASLIFMWLAIWFNTM